jgi:hypothetical protein
MLALGPDVRQNVVVDRPLHSVDLVPTLGTYLGFSPRYAQGKPIDGL